MLLRVSVVGLREGLSSEGVGVGEGEGVQVGVPGGGVSEVAEWL